METERDLEGDKDGDRFTEAGTTMCTQVWPY